MSFVKAPKAPILITGANGMLGIDLVWEISNRWGEKGVLPTDVKSLDIVDKTAVERFLKEHPVSCIVNAAAYTDVDKAESEREKAFQINVVGPKNLADVASEMGIPVIHFSTDYVFDGNGSTPLTEEDVPTLPVPNYYGETKLLGEEEVLKNPLNLVLRVQWLYGKQRERFTSLRDSTEFTPFLDQWGAPTWTRDVSRAVLQLIEQKASGVFHFAYDDYTNWAEVYTFVRDELNLDTRLIPKRSCDVKLPAKRPLYCVMSNRKLLSQLELKSLGSWKDSLRIFLKSL